MWTDLVSSVIVNVLAILVLLVFLWVIYAILYAIFMFVFSWGNEEKIKKAWSSIRYALLWFILTLIILFAIPWFLRAIKVPNYHIYTSTNIFKTSKKWLNKIIHVFQQPSSRPYSSDEEYDMDGEYSL